MAWTASNPVSVGDPTKKSHYDTLWDNSDFGRDTTDGDYISPVINTSVSGSAKY